MHIKGGYSQGGQLASKGGGECPLQLTDLQRGLINCPGWKGVSKCVDGSQGGGGDVHKLSAFKQWHCQQKAGWKQHGSTVSNKHYLLQVHGWGGLSGSAL